MTEAQPLNPAPGPSMASLSRDEDLTLPIVIYVLYLLTIPTGGIALLVGLIMAYASRDRAGPAAESHYTFQIRTFWLSLMGLAAGVALCVVGFPLSFILIGIPILLVGVAILAVGKLWFIVRCVIGIAKAAQHEPYPRPDALLA